MKMLYVKLASEANINKGRGLCLTDVTSFKIKNNWYS